MASTPSGGSHTHAVPTYPADALTQAEVDAIRATGARIDALAGSLAALTQRVALAENRLTALETPAAPPPPVTPPPPTAGAWLSYPAKPPITISGAHDVEITMQTIRDAPGSVAVVLVNCQRVHIHDVDVYRCVGAIYAMDCTDVVVEDIRASDLGDSTIGSGHGNAVQFNRVHGASAIRRVRSLGGWTEDHISVYDSGGADAAHPIVVEDCQLESPLTNQPAYRSYTTNPRNSGSAVMVESGTNVLVQRVTALNPGQGGLGYNGGTNVVYQDCVIYGAQTPQSNVGLYGLVAAGAGVRWLRNRSWWRHGPMSGQPSGYDNAWWSTDGAIKSADGNVWMDQTIDPADLRVVL